MTDVTPPPDAAPVMAPAAALPADATEYTHAALVARVDNVERQVRQWVANEVTAAIGRLRDGLNQAPGYIDAQAVPSAGAVVPTPAPSAVDTTTPPEVPA